MRTPMVSPKVLITIDTEVGEVAKNDFKGFERYILGIHRGESYGVDRIVEILEEFGMSADFFLDVYEFRSFGEEKFRDVSARLYERGQRVELHSHPAYAYDRDRRYMHQYSLDEQMAIIADGIELIERWIGERPSAHRAGGYGANNDTLYALHENRIRIDSSYYRSHANCRITGLTDNRPVQCGAVLEIPVTTYTRRKNALGIEIPIPNRFVKMDVNHLDHRRLIRYLERSKDKYWVLFLHSSSFLLRDAGGIGIKGVDYEALETFSKTLRYLDDNGYDVVNCNAIRNA
jgi:peptidoglycan/xylan/chitin deacetylase (PgdA/CDA1 family)